MRLKNLITILLPFSLSVIPPAIAPNAEAEVLRIVTSTPSLADIAKRVGGEHVRVESLMKGKENVHHVPPKPSFVMKMRKADMFIHSGLDAEPWVPQLLKTSRRRNLLQGAPDNVDASIGISLKEIPDHGTLSRANGDIHVYGNPHYMLDPLNGVIVARHIQEVLSSKDPSHADEYRANFGTFEQQTAELVDRLTKKLAPYHGAPVVVYHRAWPYFLDRFGLIEAGEVEPKPDISPGPQHLIELENSMNADGVRVIIVDTFNPLSVAERVADSTEAVAVVLAGEVHGVKGADDYFTLFETDVDRLIDAFEESEAKADPDPPGEG